MEKNGPEAMPVKPTVLQLDEAEREIFTAVEQIMVAHNLPFFLLQPIVEKLNNRLMQEKKLETELARSSYDKQLREYEADEDKQESATSGGE